MPEVINIPRGHCSVLLVHTVYLYRLPHPCSLSLPQDMYTSSSALHCGPVKRQALFVTPLSSIEDNILGKISIYIREYSQVHVIYEAILDKSLLMRRRGS